MHRSILLHLNAFPGTVPIECRQMALILSVVLIVIIIIVIIGKWQLMCIAVLLLLLYSPPTSDRFHLVCVGKMLLGVINLSWVALYYSWHQISVLKCKGRFLCLTASVQCCCSYKCSCYLEDICRYLSVSFLRLDLLNCL